MQSNIRPLVSVIVPSYNHSRYVQQCLDSIRDSGYSNYEIIIIDDGSKDDSTHVIEKWIETNKEIRIRFKSRENLGLTRTLNEMISMAQGEYICLIASDDYLLPGSIEKRLYFLIKHPDKKAVFGDCIVIDENNAQLYQSGISQLHKGRIKYLSDECFLKYELIFNWCIPGPVFMCHRDVYTQIGLYDEDLVVDDLDFYLRLLAEDLLMFFDDKIAAYRIHSFSTNQNQEIAPRLCQSFIDTVLKNRVNFNFILYMRLTSRMYFYKARLVNLQKKRRVLSLYYILKGHVVSKLSKLIYQWLTLCHHEKHS